MHILAEQIRSLDETVQAIDLGQTPSDIVILSFTDSDLALAAAVHDTLGPAAPTLRLASLATLRHPFSVDTYLDSVIRHARLVIVRCLGGMDYWRYGVDELAIAARTHGVDLAIVPGDAMADPRLDTASTLPPADLNRIWSWFQSGGPDNLRALFGWASTRLGHPAPWTEPTPLPAFGCVRDACICASQCLTCRLETSETDHPPAPLALLICYRSLLTAADHAPILALAEALRARGLAVFPVTVTSLKDPAAAAALRAAIARHRPDVILNTTAFSARQDDGGSVLDDADAPVLQVIIATTFREAWAAGPRGLGAADLAMNVVLPEVDGRLIGPAISFKADTARSDRQQFTRVIHRPDPAGITRAADLAAAWVHLRRTPRGDKKLALVLSDFPAKGGRTGYAVGLDGPASMTAIADDLRAAGYPVGPLPAPADLIRQLETREAAEILSFDDYTTLFFRLHPDFRNFVVQTWGEPTSKTPENQDFRFRALISGGLVIAVQPDRGARAARAADYHDPNRPPSHEYIAFYLWLREIVGIDALIHLGTHGTLEWLPGKSVALSNACAPAVLTGDIPVIYPFIVNNPGEAAQAKRRIGAVTIGHLTPPLQLAGTHGLTAEIEALLDEFSSAQTLDPRRANRLAEVILEKARTSGLAEESGITPDLDPATALAHLDAWVCDVKDMRIGDGLHIYARAPSPAQITATAAAIGTDSSHLSKLIHHSAKAEHEALIAALDGRFIPPGPAGAPARGRLDVLPTGRNLTAIDPRSVPTRTAYEIGSHTAEQVVARYVQDHGDWPKRIIIDLWGSATMRTGGDDLAQALALLGVRPVWDAASNRVSGFEVLSTARTGRPRVDVTLRISGLFRDVFPAQIALFDEAVRAVAALDEDEETNPLAASPAAPRIFGAAPGAYGIGLSTTVATGAWDTRSDLGEAYLAASAHAYGVGKEGISAKESFRQQVAAADAFVHVQDMNGQDLLDSDAFADHEGGFAAAAHTLGAKPALYHVDTTAPAPKVRTLPEEVARVVRARASNPRWIAGQIRHGHRGAAEIAETVQNLISFSATADAVGTHQFDLVFDATIGDDHVRDFLKSANPEAAAACARAFDEALRRGLWQTRRNSVSGRIAETLAAAP